MALPVPPKSITEPWPLPTVASGVLDLDTLDKHGEAPKTRLQDAGSAYRLFMRFLDADRLSMHNRALLQAMLDGEPPYKDNVIRQTGMGWRYNLNFLEGDTLMAKAIASHDDLVDSVDELIATTIRASVLSPEDRTDAQDIIAEEYTTLVRRDWSEFYSYWTRLVGLFVGFGVGFTYYSDERDWKWRVGGWDDFLMPRKTEATEEKVSVLIGLRSYPVHELYAHISTGAVAKGWNEDEVKRAIVKACMGGNKAKKWQRFWPSIEMDLKNNDITVGLADAEEVPCLHYWVREFDGSYSFYIGLDDGSNKDFLYKELNRYESANQAFTIFTFGVGNGTYHSIRGLAWKMFPFVQVSNRMRNSLLDTTSLAAALLLQPAEGESMDDLSVTLAGPIGYLPPGATVIERSLPNVGTQSLPVIHDLQERLENATGQYQGTGVAPDNRREQTKYEIQAQQEVGGALTSNAVNRFYRSLDRLFAEQFRRIQKIPANSTEYPEIKAFYDRCAERGVPPEVIKEGVVKVVARRAIGNGSAQLRLLALDELTHMMGMLDETGRNLAARDRIAARFGRDMADRYKPKQQRIAPDQKVAELENGVLFNMVVQAEPDENHAVHLQVHVPLLVQIVQQAVGVREQNPEADFRPMGPQIEYASRLHDHAAQHVQMLAADDTRADEAKQFSAVLEQTGNLLGAFMRLVAAQNRHADQQAQEQAGQPGAGDPSQEPELAFKAAKVQQELALKTQESQHKQQLQTAETVQRMRLRSLETDSRIRNQTLSNAARTPDAEPDAASPASEGTVSQPS
jgi:hypothetical protein